MNKRKKMKIGIDVRCFVEGRRTGVEEYTFNLLNSLFEKDDFNEYVLFLNSFHEPKGDLYHFKKFKNVKLKRFRFPNKILNLCFWYLNWPQVDKMLGGVDVFFLPNITFIGLSNKTKLILTVHDLSFVRMPETFSWKRRIWHVFISPKSLCKRADAIIAVSSSTRRDISSIYGIPAHKIRRIYNGIGEEFCIMSRNDERLATVKERYKLPAKFIFCLSTIEPRKNIISLVRAFDHLKSQKHKELENLKLVVAGNKGWKTERILDAMRMAEFSKDIIFINKISDKERIPMYNLSSVFVYPSFFEGFGLPVLEAMKCGVPVVCSNSSSLPEVVGNEAIMIDPDKPDEIFYALREVLLNRKLQFELIERGQRRTLLFNWKNTAKDFLKTVESFDKNLS